MSEQGAKESGTRTSVRDQDIERDQYTPTVGHQVRVRRYEVPTPELPGYAERRLLEEYEGTIATVRPVADGVLLTLEGMEDPIFTGYQHSGQDPDHGCSWSLKTEVVLQSEAAAHDQRELDAQVALAEREQAAALALWERARDGEVIARQRLKGAQERLEIVAGRAGLARRDAQAQAEADLTERRAADREAMATRVMDLARTDGLSAEVHTWPAQARETSVDLAGPHGLKLSVRFRGRSPQCEPDTHVLSWHGVEDGWRLSTAVFGTGAVNPHHGHKATEVANGYSELAELLAERFARIADGSAFVQVP